MDWPYFMYLSIKKKTSVFRVYDLCEVSIIQVELQGSQLYQDWLFSYLTLITLSILPNSKSKQMILFPIPKSQVI